MKEERCDKTGFCASFPWVYTSDDGKYVLHSDYAALQAENERLDKSNTSLLETIDIIDDKYGELQAENERLSERVMYLEATRPRDPNHGGKVYEMPIDEEYYANLQLENERLRKAGDAMDAYLKRLDGTTNGMLDCRRAWQAAKGVQP